MMMLLYKLIRSLYLRFSAALIYCVLQFYRFEMPFNVWCGGCESMIAKGVRFNAEKKQVGNYYSTKVFCCFKLNAELVHILGLLLVMNPFFPPDMELYNEVSMLQT